MKFTKLIQNCKPYIFNSAALFLAMLWINNAGAHQSDYQLQARQSFGFQSLPLNVENLKKHDDHNEIDLPSLSQWARVNILTKMPEYENDYEFSALRGAYTRTNFDENSYYCEVILPDVFTQDLSAMISGISSLPPHLINVSAGTAKQWKTLISLHEVQHCNQWFDHKEEHLSLSVYDQLQTELNADQQAILAYQALIKEDPDMIVPKTFLAARSISIVMNATNKATGAEAYLNYATPIFLTPEGELNTRFSKEEVLTAYQNLGYKIVIRLIDLYESVGLTSFESTPLEISTSISRMDERNLVTKEADKIFTSSIIGIVRTLLSRRNLTPAEEAAARHFLLSTEIIIPEISTSPDAQSEIAALKALAKSRYAKIIH